MRILNIGSMNLDMVYQLDHIVQPGETEASFGMNVFLGGKGINQSVAAAKAGAEVCHGGMIGEDGQPFLDACKEFEAYFMEMIFKEMQKTVDCFKSEESSSSTDGLVDYFKDTAIQDLAATSTDIQGTGLAQMLYEQMKRNYGLE